MPVTNPAPEQIGPDELDRGPGPSARPGIGTTVAMTRTDGKLSVTAYLLSNRAQLDEARNERTAGAPPESFSYSACRTFQVAMRLTAPLRGCDVAEPLERPETTGLPRDLGQLDHVLL
jgi:hypothetical protein